MLNPTRQEEFLVLLDEHKRILFKIASSYCRNAADREDLVQEMIVQIWGAFDRYDNRNRFSTWMYRVALNVAVSFYRSDTRRSRTTVPADDSILEITAEAPESAESEEDLRLLQRFIERLSDLDRALVILYLDGNRYDTMAEVLGISESNVGTKISRIKEKLRRDWAGHLREEQATWNSKI